MIYTRDDLKTMQCWSLERKIQVTQTRIMEWYYHFNGKVYVSFSGGKDSTILLDLEPEEAISRAVGKGGGDRIEALGAQYQAKVREAYLALAEKEQGRFHVIDASGSPDEVALRVRSALTAALSDGAGAV